MRCLSIVKWLKYKKSPHNRFHNIGLQAYVCLLGRTDFTTDVVLFYVIDKFFGYVLFAFEYAYPVFIGQAVSCFYDESALEI